jgi:hypothetical protein
MSFSRSPQPPAALSNQVQSFETSLSKLETITSGYPDAPKRCAADRLIRGLDQASPIISNNLHTCSERNVTELRWRFSSLADRFEALKRDYYRRYPRPPDRSDDAEKDEAIQMPTLLMEETAELEFLQAEVEQVVQVQRELHELHKQIMDIIKRDHTKVARIDEIIEDAREEMVDGNESLRRAQKHERRCLVA